MKKPYFTVKASEWRKMPPKTKWALAEMAEQLLRNLKANNPYKFNYPCYEKALHLPSLR